MLKKASKEDVAELQSYTIRSMNQQLSTKPDIEQFKLMHIKESPLDSRLKYLDVLCFPDLFPTGRFGEYHPRQVKIRPCEIIKSRLWNKDSRFRKNAQYVFFLLHLKELR